MNRASKEFGSLVIVAACTTALWAVPPAVAFMDCSLQADRTPSARTTPGLSGGSTSFNLVGSAVFRNDTDQALAIKSAIVHVKDGYDKALFDLGPYNIPSLPPHEMRSITLSHYYPGAVTVFRFSSEIVVSPPVGNDVNLTLTPQSQGAAGKSGSSKVPGY